MFPLLYESALSRSSSIPGGFTCRHPIVTTCTDGKSGVSTVAAMVILQHKSVWHGAQCLQWVSNVAAQAHTDSTISSRVSLYLMKPLLLTYSQTNHLRTQCPMAMSLALALNVCSPFWHVSFQWFVIGWQIHHPNWWMSISWKRCLCVVLLHMIVRCWTCDIVQHCLRNDIV